MLSMLGSVITDLNNWVRGWEQTTFAIVMIVLVILGFMFAINLIKGFISSGKFKFKFFSLLFLTLIIGMMVYICVIR